MTNLALRYRPAKFGEVAGQRATAAVLYAMAKKRTVPPALLFYGARGCGKTSTARILGMALNCGGEPGSASSWPCGECPSCKAVADGTSLDVLEVDAASNGSVDQIHRIRELVQYGTAGEYRVVLLDEAHSMSRDAFNALLKVLEEPPPNTVFVLLTTEYGKILPTVASRCMPFPFARLSPAAIIARLEWICQDAGVPAAPELLAAIAGRADGAMRDAIMLLDQVASVGISTLEAWQELAGEEDFAPRLVSAAADGDHKKLFEALDQVVCHTGDYATITARLVACLRDILVLSAGGQITEQGSALEDRRELAARLDAVQVVRAMRVLWDLQVKVRTEDRRSGLELAVVMVSEQFTKLAYSAARGNGNGSSNGNGNGHRPKPTEEDIMALEGFKA